MVDPHLRYEPRLNQTTRINPLLDYRVGAALLAMIAVPKYRLGAEVPLKKPIVTEGVVTPMVSTGFSLASSPFLLHGSDSIEALHPSKGSRAVIENVRFTTAGSKG